MNHSRTAVHTAVCSLGVLGALALGYATALPSNPVTVGALAILAAVLVSVSAVRNRAAFPFLVVMLVGLDTVPLPANWPSVGSISRLGLVLLFLSYLVLEAAERPAPPKGRPGSLLVSAGAFVLYLGSSLLWSPTPTEGLTALGTFVQLLALMWMCAHSVREAADLRRFVTAWVFFGLALALMTISDFVVLQQTAQHEIRATALGHDANVASSFMAIAAAALIAPGQGSGAETNPFSRRVLAVPTFLLLLVGVLATASRTGLIVFVVLSGPIGFFRLLEAGRRRTLVVYTALIIGVLVVLQLEPRLGSNILYRLTRQPISEAGGRLDLAKLALDHFSRHPLLGGGLTSFSNSYAMQVLGKAKSAHNSYLTVLSEGGIVGLACLAVLLVGAFSRGVRAVRLAAHSGDRTLFPLACAVLIMFLGTVVTGLGIEALKHKDFWLVLGLVEAASRLARSDPSPVEQPLLSGVLPG